MDQYIESDPAVCQQQNDNLFNEIEDDPHPESYVWSAEQFKWIAPEAVTPEEPEEPREWTLEEFAADHQEVVLEWYNRDDNEIRVRRFAFNTSTGSFGDWPWAETVCPEWAERNEPTPADLATMRIGQLWRAPHDDLLWFDGDRFNLNLADTQDAFLAAWEGRSIVTDTPHGDFETAVTRTTYTPRIRLSRADRDESTMETRVVFFERELVA